MFKTTIAAALLTIAALTPAVAQTSDPAVQAAVKTDLGHDFARCAAFYGLGVALAQRDWPNEDVSAGKQANAAALQMSLALLGKDVALAVFKTATDEMGRIAAGDTNRVAIVVAKYGPPCKDLLDHPENRMAHWTAIESAGAASAAKR